jgi:hypothetical protein
MYVNVYQEEEETIVLMVSLILDRSKVIFIATSCITFIH